MGGGGGGEGGGGVLQLVLYKLVLVPTPILHINFHENPLTTFDIPRHFLII